MGRESRRPRDPDALTPYGEAWAMARARQVLILVCLTHDPRIVQWGRAWVDRITLGFARLSSTRRHAEQRVYEYFADGTGISDADYASLATLLRQMGVPWEDIPGLLFVRLRQLICDGLDPAGAPSRKIDFVVTGLKDHPSGRMPRHDGDEIERDVHWWYRHHVKDPPDPIALLTKEYAAAEKRRTEAHSVIQNGLKRAETLLNSEIRKQASASDH